MISQYIIDALQQLLIPINFITLLISVFFGLLVGMLPGLTATMAIALLTGLTYRIAPDTAILSLVGVYVGSISGGCQSAILLNIPGTPASAATATDGFKIAKRGEGGLGIFLATTSSFLGTVISIFCIILLTPLLTKFALKFGSYEFFLLALFGVVICGNLTSGDDSLKGWISGILGLFIAQIGLDGLNSYPRFSFNNIELMGGITLIPVMIGLFGFPEVINAFMKEEKQILNITKFKMTEGFKIIKKNIVTVIRSGLIGVMVGIIPGVGEDIGGWLSYWAAKTNSKAKETFGQGNYEGVIAAEAGNNACVGGAIIPILSLAVPGSAPAAVLLAAFWLHGLRPGPLMMKETPYFLYQLCIFLTAGAFMMWILSQIISKFTVRVLQINKQILMPVIFVLCTVGAFVINNRIFDVYLMFIFGIVGLFLAKLNYPAAPFLLGVILGPMADTNLRRALVLSKGSLKPFFTRPISIFFIVLIMVLILSQLNFVKGLKKELVKGAK
ncbi:tripartite tricarboxylate transporter permease [Paramaledivibacter caminithermalis]|jgi:putative tricarboxylic transport membrane protein|uniref:Putative tricarboxylic transport membrane protein n=1 Tax=Paramaledivibacter caminithermalis (strain DSM 15212 / CIP 107654 / DViRD3) TaxID=1121301 RepID=A0A1M6NSY0_PARC5|nr:tripartite tricarboxylate transporter permease [Paramaledivibacter caminithermalis]SHJ98817.1 putative tricarboxylic transport membrane protein [Paramaledivibacter caminithermalis DSM 15212]